MRKTTLAALALAVSPMAAFACPVPGSGVTALSISEADLGEDPYRVEVIAGGDQDLSQCGYAGGHVIENPDFSITMSGISGPIQVSVDSPGCDTVLLAHAPDGSWYYDDDSSGDLMPWMEVVASDGQFDFWIGTYSAGEFCEAHLVLY